jgi:hypothetical protein
VFLSLYVSMILEPLREKLGMDLYTDIIATTFKLNPSDDWLRKKQGLALPVLPPTTLEARKYFFRKVREYAALASSEGKRKVDYEAFAREWNKSADGKQRFYITTELLVAYSKSWEKNSNIRTSQEMIVDKLHMVALSAQIFSAPARPFPSYLTASPHSTHPSQGVLDIEDGIDLPSSISTELALSRPSQPSRHPSLPVSNTELLDHQ